MICLSVCAAWEPQLMKAAQTPRDSMQLRSGLVPASLSLLFQTQRKSVLSQDLRGNTAKKVERDNLGKGVVGVTRG